MKRGHGKGKAVGKTHGYYAVPGYQRVGWDDHATMQKTRQLLKFEVEELLQEALAEEEPFEFYSETFDYDPRFLSELGLID